MTPRVLGLDLAWSARNPSGLAALELDGRIASLETQLRGDDEILAWVRHWRTPGGVIGIDMPTIVRNLTGTRPCEDAVRREFFRQHAGPYPANRGLVPFHDGGRAARLIAQLKPDGVEETLAYRPGDPRTIAIEVFPHAAHVALFGLERIFKYKRKVRNTDYRAEWKRYRARLASLAEADPPLRLDSRIPPDVDDELRYKGRRYKAWDDALDAITCAYVAAFVHRWGLQEPHVRVFGDDVKGYIVVPMRPVWPLGEPGTSAPWRMRTSPS